MKIKTTELTGAALDWAVAIATGISANAINTRTGAVYLISGLYQPSANWAHGGPIFLREKIAVFSDDEGTWSARIRSEEDRLMTNPVSAKCTQATGPTPLIAAMRCLVLKRLGLEVDIPDDLA